MRRIITILLTLATLLPVMAQQDTDTGLWMSADVQKKLSKKWSIEAGAEYRLREDFGSSDRWTIGLQTAYKPMKWLKLDAGYKFLRMHYDDETKYKDNGVDPRKWTPSYWGSRHRVYASATGTFKTGRLDLSLRERWQYTYRPEQTIDRYDIDDDEWESKTKSSKAQHELRSRLQVDYNIPRCKVDPFLSAELYHAKGGLQKTRYTVGADWKLKKQHVVSFFYRYIDEKDVSDPDLHAIGIGYKYKF